MKKKKPKTKGPIKKKKKEDKQTKQNKDKNGWWWYYNLAAIAACFISAIGGYYYSTGMMSPSSDSSSTSTENKELDNHHHNNQQQPLPAGTGSNDDKEQTTKNDFDADSCHYVMAESTVPNGGFGVYTLQSLAASQQILSHNENDSRGDNNGSGGDPVIQVPNVVQEQAAGMAFLTHRYSWEAAHTGGQFEGETVQSILPGLGMLANAHPVHYNVIPAFPVQHHADVTRGQAAAGSFTHYQDYRWYAERSIAAGDEIFVNYGASWNETKMLLDFSTFEQKRSVEWLKENGMCLDYLTSRPAPGRGYGAFSTRALKKGSVIAPVPVVPLHRSSLNILQVQPAGNSHPINDKQLLLNYCYGHADSSVLLFPYSPMVNLINHDYQHANAYLRWSQRTSSSTTTTSGPTIFQRNDPAWFTKTAHQVLATHKSGLLLELVALRDIAPNEQVVINYGEDYEMAWNEHLLSYQDRMAGAWSDSYAYPHQVNAIVQTIKTVDEQEQDPYPSNLQLQCFILDDDEASPQQGQQQPVVEATDHNDDGNTTTKTTVWHHSPRVFQPRYLRPCQVLQRQLYRENQQQKTTGRASERSFYLYTVELQQEQQNVMEDAETTTIPQQPTARHNARRRHIVSGLPREALYFSSKKYTTDQHLPYAFRHEIGLPDNVFPAAWKDLQRKPDTTTATSTN